MRFTSGANVDFMRSAAMRGKDVSPFIPDMRHAANDEVDRLAQELAREDAEGTIALLLAAVRDSQHREDSLRYKSEMDGLTGLYNQGAFHDYLADATKRASKFGHNLSLIGIDLDMFKPINDEHGHLAGDAVLKEVGRLLHHHLREHDFIARTGGDEFSVVLMGANPQASYAIQSRLSRVFSKATCTWDGQELPVRASVGLAIFKNGQSANALVKAADTAMYAIKQSKPGRVARGGTLPKTQAAAGPSM